MVSSMTSSSKLLGVVLAALLGNLATAVEFFTPDWIIPLEIGTPYPTMTVNAGDSLTFAWSQGTHDVWIYPSGSCDPTDAVMVGSIDDNPTTYFFSEAEAGSTITFACDVGAHCDAGMIMDVIVLGSADESDDLGFILDDLLNPEEPAAEEDDELVLDGDSAVEEFGVCYICGDAEGEVTEPDFVVSLPNPNGPRIQVSCSQLFQDGLDGVIPDDSCSFISSFAQIPCGCVSPNFSCNICGDNAEETLEIKTPDFEITLPDDPETPITCGALATAGASGELSPAECQQATIFAFNQCECAPVDFTCSICGEGFVPNDPDFVIDVIPGLEGQTCGGLDLLGSSGALTPQECRNVEAFNRFENGCQCVPEEGYPECPICEEGAMPMTPDVNLTLGFGDVATCQSIYEEGLAGSLGPGRCAAAQNQAILCNCAAPDYTCSVCGGDGTNTTMLLPDTNFTIPGNGALVNCGEVDAAGFDGIINPNDCALLQPLATLNCGCAPTGFACNICGQDSGQAVTNLDEVFIPGEDLTCAEVQAQGAAGEVPPLRCAAITPFAQTVCGCSEDATIPPVVPGTDEPVVSLPPLVGEEQTEAPMMEVPQEDGDDFVEVPTTDTAPETTETTTDVATDATSDVATDATAPEASPEEAPAEDTPPPPTPDLVIDPGTSVSSAEGSLGKASGATTASFALLATVSFLLGTAAVLLV